MIGVKDSLTLAYTKYRTRKVRSIMFAITASLFFGIICFFSIISSGFLTSIKPYTTYGYGSRYLTSANNVVDFEKVNKRAFEFTLEKYETEKAAAKAKGDPEPERPAEGSASKADYDRATNELYPPITTADYKNKISSFKPIDVFEIRSSSDALAETKFIKDGKEIGETGDTSINEVGGFGSLSSQSSLESPVLEAYSDSLMTPFLYKDQSTSTNATAIPALIPANIAAELLGINFDSSLTVDQKSEAYKRLQTELIGKTIDICVRNETAVSLRANAIEQASTIEANKSNRDYVAPALQYAIPKNACEPVQISKDTRTEDQKKFEKELQKDVPAAVTKKYSLQVVGFISSNEYTDSSILNSIFTSGPKGVIVVSLDAVKKDPYLTSVFTTAQSSQQLIAEFTDRKAQKNYIEQTCKPDYSFGGDFSFESIYKECIEKKQLYAIGNFGNNAVTLDDIRESFVNKVIRIATIVVFIIAAISMMGTISKIVADSRRETGVFRALGAKRLDIAQIYYTYAAIIALISACIALILGSLVSLWLDAKYSTSLTKSAITTFANYQDSSAVGLFSINPKQIVAIFIAAVASAWVGSTLPILRNVGRHPIKAMRED